MHVSAAHLISILCTIFVLKALLCQESYYTVFIRFLVITEQNSQKLIEKKCVDGMSDVVMYIILFHTRLWTQCTGVIEESRNVSNCNFANIDLQTLCDSNESQRQRMIYS